jgi:hypothetical protein
MADEPKESSEMPPAQAATPPDGDPGRDDHASAVRDLADGLDLMLRAARKAVRHVDPQNIEALGRRALDNLDALKRRRVEDLRNEAKRRLDRRRFEEIAEDAGKELLRVVERVADRVDAVVNRGAHASDSPTASAPSAPAQGDDKASPDDPDASKRVRIAEE